MAGGEGTVHILQQSTFRTHATPRLWRQILVAGMVHGVALSGALAQQPAGDSAWLLATTERPLPLRVEASRVLALRLPITMGLDSVTLEDALQRITLKAGLGLTYGEHFAELQRRISLHAINVSVAEALTTVVEGTGLDLLAWSTGHLIVVRRPAAARPVRHQGVGTVAGRVTDAVTRGGLDQVALHIEGTSLGALTASDGHYTIRNVPVGAYHVTARRVGYAPLTKTATVGADSVATVDFALAGAPTKLSEVVTTAVGDQRRYEVGNVISTINADSIAPTAPITSLTDLISARAPGVEVLETSGMAGSGEAIRIRGLSSLVLQNDPILVVDGVRQDNAAGADIGGSFTDQYGPVAGTHPTPTRLNDIDFSDVASIDVLKGPSASTEYGTDAANGVIVITTKRGTAGAPRWHASAEETVSGLPVQFADGYYSWGHTTDGSHAPVACTLVSIYGTPSSTAGTCAVDSVTRWNPLNHQATSIFGTGNRGKYDVSVSGGSDMVRYFVAGGLSNETGVIGMPRVFRQLADTANVGLPNSALNPNREQQRSVRVNTAITIGTVADLTATGSYLSMYQQTPDAKSLYEGVYYAPALGDAAHYYGYDFFGSSILTPLAELSALGSQNTDRVTGGLTGNWRPTQWFVGHATVGVDHGSQRNQMLNYPFANTAYELYQPFLGIVDGTTDVYSVDLRGTATASLAPRVRAVTSGGLQMVDRRTASQSASASGITATNLTLNGVTGATVHQVTDRQATLGGYAEEEIGVADRLFLTGALRIDAGSAFGHAYTTAAYPKASVSWLAVNDGPTTLRVRGAFGESGVQPANGAATTLYTPTLGYLGGAYVTTYTPSWPGNQHLRPERSAEFEGGLDASGWRDRVTLDITAYSKTTRDALVNVSRVGDVCCSTFQENVGEVRNSGVEGSGTVGLVRRRAATWDVTVNASANHNTLVSLAPGIANQVVAGQNVTYRQTPGYPLYGFWGPRVIYHDANHDGIIEASEASLSDSATYVGPSLPTREASVATHLTLMGGAITMSALADYRGGYRIANVEAINEAYVGRLREQNDPRAPLWLQARAIENNTFVFNNLDAEDGSFVRVRELSLTYVLPRSVTRALRAQSVSVTGAVRNLALWTRYTGADPEVSNTLGGNVRTAATIGGTISGANVNNDARADWGAVPLARYWVVRLNLAL